MSDLERWSKFMKPIYITLIMFAVGCVSQAQTSDVRSFPTDPAARREEFEKRMAASPPKSNGHVFAPAGDYPKDKEIEVHLTAPAHLCAYTLSNLTKKEVFISARVQSISVPEITIKARPEIIVAEIIKKLKEANISVVEIGPYTLALVDIPINSPQPAIVLK